MAKPTHQNVYFLRSVRVAREAIAGLPSAVEGEPQVIVINRGEKRKLVIAAAVDLTIQGSVVEDSDTHRTRITADIAAMTAENRNLKKAA